MSNAGSRSKKKKRKRSREQKCCEERKPSQLAQLLVGILREMNDVLELMQKGDGWLVFRDEVAIHLCRGKLKWWEFYTDEKTYRKLFLLAFVEKERLNESTEESMVEYKRIMEEEFAELLASDVEVAGEQESRELLKRIEELPEDEREKEYRKIALFWAFVLVGLFNMIAIMVFGRSMFRLVERATGGDDEAFMRAVQIDRATLLLPAFQERMLRAQLKGDKEFLQGLSYRLKNPTLKGKIRYRTLWLTFAILDDESLLDRPHEELFELCQELGVYGKEYGVEDVGHLTKRLQEYRREQRKAKNNSRP